MEAEHAGGAQIDEPIDRQARQLIEFLAEVLHCGQLQWKEQAATQPGPQGRQLAELVAQDLVKSCSQLFHERLGLGVVIGLGQDVQNSHQFRER